MSTALKREHHFVKKCASSGADLRSRLLKWVRRCNGASTRAPKSTKKLTKTAMNLPIMLKFQIRAFRLSVSEKVPNGKFSRTTKSERLSWECPKKQDNSKFHKKIKSRLCIAKNRKRAPPQDFQQKKKERVYNAGYQICKIKIRWKNAEAIDLRYLPRRSAGADRRCKPFRLRFLRKLLWFYRF